jgi:hypothetical protein
MWKQVGKQSLLWTAGLSCLWSLGHCHLVKPGATSGGPPLTQTKDKRTKHRGPTFLSDLLSTQDCFSAKQTKRKEGQQILFLAIKWLTFQEIKILNEPEGISIHSASLQIGSVLHEDSIIQGELLEVQEGLCPKNSSKHICLCLEIHH